MIKYLPQLEHFIEQKAFRFIFDNTASIPHIKEALFQFQKFIGQCEDSEKEKEVAKQASTAPVPEVPAPTVEEVK